MDRLSRSRLIIFLTPSALRWQYRGQISKALQTIENKYFSNVSSVTGTRTLKGGLVVTVFHDTNPGNHGPSDSFYRRDAAGSSITAPSQELPLEKQLTPYQIIRFPDEGGPIVPAIQPDRHRFQRYRRDGTNEHVDVEGLSTVMGQNRSQSGRNLSGRGRVETRMTLKSASPQSIARRSAPM